MLVPGKSLCLCPGGQDERPPQEQPSRPLPAATAASVRGPLPGLSFKSPLWPAGLGKSEKRGRRRANPGLTQLGAPSRSAPHAGLFPCRRLVGRPARGGRFPHTPAVLALQNDSRSTAVV